MKTKKNINHHVKLDAEEQELLKSYEEGEWKSVAKLSQEKNGLR